MKTSVYQRHNAQVFIKTDPTFCFAGCHLVKQQGNHGQEGVTLATNIEILRTPFKTLSVVGFVEQVCWGML